MKHTLKVTSVSTMAFDNQNVRMENDDVSIDLRFKNQNDHHSLAVGDTVEVEMNESGEAKSTSKAKSKAKSKKK